MRIFLAISPPAELRRAAWDAFAPLRETTAPVAWVREEKIHLTLKFLGSIPTSSIDSLTEAMTDVGARHAAPMVGVQTAGAFPTFRRPRVLWLGVDPEPRLELLHHDIEVACNRLGYELDGRPFRPHLTLGRVREPLPLEDAKALRAAARQVRFSDHFHARSIDVMQSVPGPAGSTYTLVASAPMRGS